MSHLREIFIIAKSFRHSPLIPVGSNPAIYIAMYGAIFNAERRGVSLSWDTEFKNILLPHLLLRHKCNHDIVVVMHTPGVKPDKKLMLAFFDSKNDKLSVLRCMNEPMWKP